MKIETKKSLYEIVKQLDETLRFEHDVLNLISSIWDVYQKSATGEDNRYKVLGDEIDKHYFINDDWTQDKLYLSVLHILDDDDSLLRFVEGLLDIAQIGENNDVIKQVNKILKEEGLSVKLNEYSWEISRINETGFYEVDKNLPFVRCKSKITNYVRFEEKDIELPDEEKCFVVTFNYEWNDFSNKTWFRLYYKDGRKMTPIGSLKIMSLSNANTDEVLPERFNKLDNDYCSLGCDVRDRKSVV